MGEPAYQTANFDKISAEMGIVGLARATKHALKVGPKPQCSSNLEYVHKEKHFRTNSAEICKIEDFSLPQVQDKSPYLVSP
jgi:hypothetical protein